MLMILCGKSGSGKDAIQTKLERYGYHRLVSYTTRPMRENEKNGVTYNFVSKDQFLKMMESDQLIEWRSYNTLVNGVEDTWYYGLKKTSLCSYITYTVILDIEGAKEAVRYYGADKCFVVYVDVPDDTRKERAVQRGSFDETEWNRRLEDDNIKFADSELEGLVNYRVSNTGKLHWTLHKIIHHYIAYPCFQKEVCAKLDDVNSRLTKIEDKLIEIQK